MVQGRTFRGAAVMAALATAATLAGPAQAMPDGGRLRPGTATPRALSALGTAAPQASTPPGSVVFIRDRNVWIARPDGSAARRLTANATAKRPYRYPSEDDYGHVVALRGDKFVRMNQHGHVLDSFTAPVTRLGTDFASVSPDGTKIAYSWLSSYTDCSFSPCHTFFVHTLAYSKATRRQAVSGAGSPADVQWASWVTNRRVVVGGRDEDVRYHDLGTRKSKEWYTDCSYVKENCADPNASYWNLFPAVSRQGDRYAAVVIDLNLATGSPRHTFLGFLNTAHFAKGNPPARPTHRCSVDGIPTHGAYPGASAATIQTPSWAPGGRSLVAAFETAAKHWQVRRFDIPRDVTKCGAYTSRRILKNATQPRWSPAPLH